MSITTQTRWDSYKKLNQKRLYDIIVSVLKEHKEQGLTASSLAVILYNQGLIKDCTRQATAPRLTELVDKDIVVIIGKRLDKLSDRKVAVYSLKEVD